MNTIRIDQQIGYDPLWEEGVASADIRASLALMDGGDVTVWLNSPGGDVLEASAIYTALRDYPGKVTVKVEALAASAASVIAMAADELLMSPTAYLMIHRASTVTAGNVDDMDEAARQLRSIDQGIVEAYRLKTGMSRAKILELMKEETWISAKAAVDMGFADGILFADQAAPDEGEPEEEEKPEEENIIKATARVRSLVFSNIREVPLHMSGKPDPAPITAEEAPAPEPDPAPEAEAAPAPAEAAAEPETVSAEEEARRKAEVEEREKELLQARLALSALLDDIEGGIPE